MKWFKKRRIFLDFAGGEMNPTAIHKEGVAARKRLDGARLKIARILGVQQRDIIFTSGGTESDNLAILGSFEIAKEKFEKPHLIISDMEHPAVGECAKEVERRGGEVTIIKSEDGRVSVEEVLKAVKENTFLVSTIYAANETGAINNVPKIGRLLRDMRRKGAKKYPLFHTDATAAYDYLDVGAEKLFADLVTIDKVLVVRPSVTLRPLIVGGGHERGLRAGTPNVRAAEDFAASLEATVKSREKELKRLGELKKIFIEEVSKISGATVNTPEESLPSIVSVSFPGKLHEFLAIKLDEEGVAVSTGSSCDSQKNLEKSEDDKEALRFSFGSKTNKSDVKEAIRILREIVI